MFQLQISKISCQLLQWMESKEVNRSLKIFDQICLASFKTLSITIIFTRFVKIYRFTGVFVFIERSRVMNVNYWDRVRSLTSKWEQILWRNPRNAVKRFAGELRSLTTTTSIGHQLIVGAWERVIQPVERSHQSTTVRHRVESWESEREI